MMVDALRGARRAVTANATQTAGVYEHKALGVSMNDLNPTREDFAALLEESLAATDMYEGSVIKGKVVGIEKDLDYFLLVDHTI